MKVSICHIRRAPSRALAAISIVAIALLCSQPSALQAQSPNKPHRKLLLSTQPEYPDVLKRGHFQGQVRLEATVQPNGNVSNVEVKGGNPMLSRYASEAVWHWKYAPGSAQTVEEVVFNFNANDH